MVNFIPEKVAGQSQDNVPFYEDVTSKEAAGVRTSKSLASLQQEVTHWLAKLNAVGVTFTPGQYPGVKPRSGFQINFVLGANRGRIDCAALPMRSPTTNKKDRALAQALFLLRDELKAAVMSSYYKPGSVPLLPYLLDNKGHTVTESMIESGAIPHLLPAGNGK